LRSRLIATQDLQAGDSVGYGSAFTADAPMRMGVVACGYADGYPRHCPTGTPVLVEGVRTRTLGRVSMDMIAVDLTPCPTAGFGSDVTLWGKASNGAVLPIDEVAMWAAAWQQVAGDAGLATQLGAAGVQRAKDFAAPLVLAAWVSYYKSIAHNAAMTGCK
jgi:alanine racemase